jgi:hypothetical protein
MEISEDDIKLIIKLISDKLGPKASPEKIRSLAAETIEQLSIISENEPKVNNLESMPNENKKLRKLIVNAFGLAKSDLEDSLRSFLLTRKLPLIALSSINIGEYSSLIAIIDYSDFRNDINRLKFEISELCEKFGFKTIVQDSAYYGN